MIFHVTEPPRMSIDNRNLEINHKVVVDDSDMNIMSPDEIMSYFPAVSPGFQRVSVIQGHDTPGFQTLFMIIDRERHFSLSSVAR